MVKKVATATAAVTTATMMKVVARVAVLLLLLAPAIAQEASPFTVLTTSADLQNRKLYAEIMCELRLAADNYRI
ncbi:MAG: hypothetical protein LBF67_04285 [Prevotellaceae bacterium]|jgi:competence protein ComGC|nr:hypothetical protein [Prevotellaceae bacterium]